MVMLAPQTVARILELSTSRVRQLDVEGVLPALRDSAGRRFWTPESVERYAAERQARQAAQHSADTVGVGG